MTQIKYPDLRTVERIALMHPSLRAETIALFEQAAAELKMTPQRFIRTAYTLRTWAEQAELFAQGRTKPGKIITNAAPGMSFHNYGLAFDIVVIENGAAVFDANDPLWFGFVKISKAHGWTWGGDFKSFKDFPHFEKSPRPVRELLSMYKNGKTFTDGGREWVQL